MQQYADHLRFIDCRKCTAMSTACPLCMMWQCKGIYFVRLGTVYVTPLALCSPYIVHEGKKQPQTVEAQLHITSFS